VYGKLVKPILEAKVHQYLMVKLLRTYAYNGKQRYFAKIKLKAGNVFFG
jgi:hypothetical protein